MMGNKRYYWLRLKVDFFKQKEIKKLRRIAGGDTYTIIYLKLQLLSIKTEGKLYFDGIEDTFVEEIALELDEEVENVRMTLMFLMKHELVEEVTHDEIFLPQAAECIGKETASTIRSRKSRANKKMLQCNTNATKCNTEKEKEKEIEKEKESSSKRSNEEEEIKLIMSFCQKYDFKLRKCDAVTFIDSFGYKLVNKALGLAVTTETFTSGAVRSYKAYLAKVLKDLSINKETHINITKENKGNKFNNYNQRQYDKNLEDEFLGWD